MATIGSYAQQLSLLNQLNSRYTSMNKHVTAISTGNKVNSAADDASTYSIGQSMGVRIGSLEQASANTQTGNSMLKVADGALSNTLDILTTLKEKAVEAANSTSNDSDRQNLQTMLNQYIDQIDDNALVEYNGMALMNGGYSAATQLTQQAYTNTSLSTDTTGSTKLTDLATRSGETLNIASTDTVNVSYVKNGKTYHTSYSAADTTLEDIFKAANNAGGGDVFDTTIGSTEEIGINSSGKTTTTTDGKNAITVKAADAGKSAAIAGFTISITDADGNEKKFANNALDSFSETIAAADDRKDNSLTLQTGADANQSIQVNLGNISSTALGLRGTDGSYLSLATEEDANAAINVIQNAIDKVLDQSTNVGSVSSRLDYTYSNLTTETENLTAAQTTLLSADLAKEITQYTSDSILAQSAQAMLAQSYQNSSWFLNLLG